MKRIAYVFLVAAAAAAPVFAGGGHREALRRAVVTNGVGAAKAVLAGIDWRDVRDPVSEIRELKGQVEGRAGFEGVERELKTKLRLLTPGAKMDGRDDTLAVPVMEVPVAGVFPVDLPSVAFPGAYETVRIPVLPDIGPVIAPAHGGVGAYFIPPWAVPIRVVTVPAGFSRGFSEWAARYGKRERFLNADGTAFEPDWGTSLYRLRQEVESGADRYDALIDAYNERVRRALWRRKILGAPAHGGGSE